MPNRIIITLSGGVVQDVYADSPEGLDVIVVDHDTDGCDDPRVVVDPETGARFYRCPAPPYPLAGSPSYAVEGEDMATWAQRLNLFGDHEGDTDR